MVAWAIRNFGGLVPRTQSRNLPPNMADQAVNCDLSSGDLVGLPNPQLTVDLATSPLLKYLLGPPLKAYRFPGPPGSPDVWLPLSSPYSSVCRSPLANLADERLYWTNPGDLAPHW